MVKDIPDCHLGMGVSWVIGKIIYPLSVIGIAFITLWYALCIYGRN